MKVDSGILDNTQKNMLALVNLFARYGYAQYKMSKFEAYDLYSKNKGFLVNDSVITFTDTNGKLMALKPDVTLSIVKNADKALKSVEKLYYNESVYRVSKHTASLCRWALSVSVRWMTTTSAKCCCWRQKVCR